MKSAEQGAIQMISRSQAISTHSVIGSEGSIRVTDTQETSEPYWPALQIHSARPDWLEFSLACSIEAADQLNELLVWCFADLREDFRESIRTALRELLMNAIEWGGKSDASQRVRVAILRGRRVVLCRIVDPGKGFRLENITHAAIGYPDDRPCDHMRIRQQKGLRPGGFGLTIVRSSADELIYNDAGNEVVFIKYIDPPSLDTPLPPAS